MSTALLFTDCQDKNLQLQRKIGQILPCKVAPLHDTLVENARADVIVSDVALDSPVVTEMLRLALEKYREENVPLLFLLQELNPQSIRCALDLGASKILDAACPQHMLTAALSGLLGSESDSGQRPAGSESDASVKLCVAGADAVIAEAMEAVRRDEPIAPHTIIAGAESVLKTIQNHSLRSWLDVVWTYDDLTYQHCLLVAGLAASFALKLGFSQHDCQRLTGAAMLHDIGKAKIPKEILNKPGRLNENERLVMQTHSAIGADLLRRQGQFNDDMISVVRHHHEYLDGTGYPDRLQSYEIGDLVRMTTICDIYAALIERRPYKEPMSMSEAFAILAGMEGKLDTALVKAFEIVVCDA